jgi:hypothetical protein
VAFPANWPPRVATGVRSIRFYTTGTATANFADSAFLFGDSASANTYVPLPVVMPGSNTVVNVPNSAGTGQNNSDLAPMIWAQTIRLCNDGGGSLEYSFDGTNIHGKLLANESVVYRNRFEAGITVRGAGVTFRIEAW